MSISEIDKPALRKPLTVIAALIIWPLIAVLTLILTLLSELKRAWGNLAIWSTWCGDIKSLNKSFKRAWRGKKKTAETTQENP